MLRKRGGALSGKGKNTRFLMVQGTMSGAGKSLVVAGLCRILRQDGVKVCPFKSQNMALNSYVTKEGLEMGRAQVMQAEAAKAEPSVYMNPILLKPTDDQGSQVIVNGKSIGNMRARDYFKYKKNLIPDIMAAIDKLKEEYEVIIIEGAGSPAEINLKENDIVNMGMAALVDAPVLLVGDIDRGGVFAQLLGTLELLESDERERVKGLIVNKFRGDKTILDPGIEMLEERGRVPVAGVLPYIKLNLEDEDSLTDRFDKRRRNLINIGVIRLPRISNFTDFDVFEQVDSTGVEYITRPNELKNVDLLIIPGSKNTIDDMKWLKETGLESAVKKYAAKGGPVIGICGGYQMLGYEISDPKGVEKGGSIEGFGLLPLTTLLKEEKHLEQVSGSIVAAGGIFKGLSGKSYKGYEIHMGETTVVEDNLLHVQAGNNGNAETEEEKDAPLLEFTPNGSGYTKGNIYGTYVHGIFDDAQIVKTIVNEIAMKKGVSLELDEVIDYAELKDKEYDKLAAMMREYMNMDMVYELLGMKERR